MSKLSKVLLSAVVSLAFIAILFVWYNTDRYEIISASDQGNYTVFKIDKNTGQVWVIVGYEEHHIKKSN